MHHQVAHFWKKNCPLNHCTFLVTYTVITCCYRHTFGAVLSAIITLVVCLQIFGLVSGVIGQGTNVQPHERGCVSNAGGNMLIA